MLRHLCLIHIDNNRTLVKARLSTPPSVACFEAQLHGIQTDHHGYSAGGRRVAERTASSRTRPPSQADAKTADGKLEWKDIYGYVDAKFGSSKHLPKIQRLLVGCEKFTKCVCSASA